RRAGSSARRIRQSFRLVFPGACLALERGMRKARGFSLVEVGVGLAIVSALAGISILALRGLKQRGDYAGATGDVVTGLRLARSESFGRGQATYFIIDTPAATGVRWWRLLD